MQFNGLELYEKTVELSQEFHLPRLSVTSWWFIFVHADNKRHDHNLFHRHPASHTSVNQSTTLLPGTATWDWYRAALWRQNRQINDQNMMFVFNMLFIKRDQGIVIAQANLGMVRDKSHWLLHIIGDSLNSDLVYQLLDLAYPCSSNSFIVEYFTTTSSGF